MNERPTLRQRLDLTLTRVTLDGNPAQISVPTPSHARIVDRNGRGIDATWPSVARIVARGGEFHSN